MKAILKGHGLLGKIPVTIADIGDVYLSYPQLIQAVGTARIFLFIELPHSRLSKVDLISANAFPMWEKKRVEHAASYLMSRLAPLYRAADAQHKRMVIGESGWSSGGYHANASLATPQAQVVSTFGSILGSSQQYADHTTP